MSAERRLKVVLCWHMHQPHYCDLISGEYQLPWTYLHTIKDYIDMAAHLEAVPRARAVINFAPILLEQIADYAGQVRGYLRDNKAIRDPLLAALASPTLPVTREQRLSLVSACLRVNEHQIVRRFPDYHRLTGIANCFRDHPNGIAYISDQFLVDLLVWYHLGWLAETVRRDDHRARRLLEKGVGFSLHDRRELLTLIGDLLSSVIDRYRRLAESGQVELSLSPYAHPIVPLLLDLGCAAEAMPDVILPLLPAYPGGEERARWHISEGIATFVEYFGARPAGCWPSEGSVSSPALRLLEEYGFKWVASGETVLHNSLKKAGKPAAEGRGRFLYRPYCLRGTRLACFFRDEGLSDLIGFTYSDWHADDAVANLVQHLENIADDTVDQPDAVVSIVLDGENAWEHYPLNGYYFLSALYRRLCDHPRIEMTTFSECLKGGCQAAELPRIVAGSWVYGTFSTWVGDGEKNRAWDMLGEAKRAYDVASKEGYLEDEQLLAAQHQLSICEGSDWFWWFGDYNPADTVSDFERLYRMHLSNLYQLLGKEPPEYLAHSFTRGGGKPALGGVMRHGQEAG
jgi:alpha-amylase/alpha-mannosidase (GH57 family)